MDVHLPRGTRDFLPADMAAREHVIRIVTSVFERYGFEPLATPSFERIETLTGKYGDEGERLIYRILKRGEGGERGEADLALRYDLTVPLARVIAMNRQLRMPFKRYQIQPVWRADRPARGRFREFWQCDVDVVGATSALADAECLAVVHDAMRALGFAKFTIRLNDRRILADLAARAGATDAHEEASMLVALDKLDKIGRDGVERELVDRGFDPGRFADLWSALEPQQDDDATLAHLQALLAERGREGVARLREVRAAALGMGVRADSIAIDPTLARGLDYYTGPVYETVVTEPNVGSLSGGGRYDGLIGMFASEAIPAVGVSLGLERILAVMEELGMLPAPRPSADVLVTVFDDACRPASVEVARRLREAGVATELYLGDGRLKAQLKLANARAFPWAIVIGPDEAASGEATLKNLVGGDQDRLSIDLLVERLATGARRA